MKYVMGRGIDFVVFPNYIKHDTFKNMNPVSAGFCKVTTEMTQWGEETPRFDCYGESSSLKLKSRGEKDSIIITSGMRTV
jgi:hypothetical protein